MRKLEKTIHNALHAKRQYATRGTCAQAHEKELLEFGVQLAVQLTAHPEGLPSRD